MFCRNLWVRFRIILCRCGHVFSSTAVVNSKYIIYSNLQCTAEKAQGTSLFFSLVSPVTNETPQMGPQVRLIFFCTRHVTCRPPSLRTINVGEMLRWILFKVTNDQSPCHFYHVHFFDQRKTFLSERLFTVRLTVIV